MLVAFSLLTRRGVGGLYFAAKKLLIGRKFIDLFFIGEVCSMAWGKFPQ
jgi:hypothetical protein